MNFVESSSSSPIFKNYYDAETQMCSAADLPGFGVCRSEYSPAQNPSAERMDFSTQPGVWRRNYWNASSHPEISGTASVGKKESLGDSLLGGLAQVTVGILTMGGCGASVETPSVESPVAETTALPAPLPDPNEVMKNSFVHWNVEVDGDPRVGVVLFIRQPSFSSSRPIQDRTEQESLAVSLYQALIVNLLDKHEVTHIFSEGISEDVLPLESDGLIQSMKTKIQELTGVFPIWPEKNPEIMIADILETIPGGATPAYALFHGGVWIHKTLTKEEQAETQRPCFPVEPECTLKYKYDRLESRAVREINAFLEKNPGERVALVFGATHQICDDFEKLSHPPRVISAWIEMAGIDSANNALRLNLPDPCGSDRPRESPVISDPERW